MSDYELAQQLIHQIAKRHDRYAAPVQNSPIHGVNVWKDELDRYPADTVWITEGKFSWGPNWEHVAFGVDVATVADLVVETIA